MKKAANVLFLFLALAATLLFAACGDESHNASVSETGTIVFNLSHPGEVTLTTPDDVTFEEVAHADDNLMATFEVPWENVYVATALPDDDVTFLATTLYDISVAPGETTEKSIDFAANTGAIEDAIAALNDAIAALQEALANNVSKEDLEALKQDLLDAIDAIEAFDLTALEGKVDDLLAKIDELIGKVDGVLEDVKKALEELKLALTFTASLNATCIDPSSSNPIAGCQVSETGIAWSEFPEGENFARTCTTGADGNCTIEYLLPASDLLEGESLRFRAEAVGYASDEVFLSLPANRPRSFQFRLSADQPDGTIECQDFRLDTGEVREDALDRTFVWEGGVKRTLTADERAAAHCTVLTGVEYFSIDPTCVPLSQISDGCGTFQVSINGLTCVSSVRAGDTGFCP
ncbi:hypothetical protein KKA33_00350 [Patescibacteria group bacterium]|nr:hypothetical protein [Patescibacteria group bacterium]